LEGAITIRDSLTSFSLQGVLPADVQKSLGQDAQTLFSLVKAELLYFCSSHLNVWPKPTAGKSRDLIGEVGAHCVKKEAIERNNSNL
jgi:hypothetical protein